MYCRTCWKHSSKLVFETWKHKIVTSVVVHVDGVRHVSELWSLTGLRWDFKFSLRQSRKMTTFMMEPVSTSETSVHREIAQRYVPGSCDLQWACSSSPKWYMSMETWWNYSDRYNWRTPDLCPPHGLARAPTWAYAMRGRRLTTWAMARSSDSCNGSYCWCYNNGCEGMSSQPFLKMKLYVSFRWQNSKCLRLCALGSVLSVVLIVGKNFHLNNELLRNSASKTGQWKCESNINRSQVRLGQSHFKVSKVCRQYMDSVRFS
jgi:hypothetical protein